MGNSSSKCVTLQASSSSLTAGETLSGSVLVSVPENAKTSPSNLLVGASLLFIGKEDCKVEYTTSVSDGKGNSRTERRHAYSKRDVLRAVIPLASHQTHTNTSTVIAGSCAIPFEYKIPEDLPSSFYHASHGGHCMVRYKLKLQFKGGEKELPLQIASKAYSGPALPHLVQPVTAPVSLCCCIPKGSITVAANVSNTRIAPGQQVVVDLGAKNESSSQVDIVTASIYQRIHWKAGGHSSCWDNKIVSMTFRVTEEMRAKNKESMREIAEQKKRSGTRGPSDDIYREILNAVRDGANQVTLVIPVDAKHSYMGSLVTVTHRLCIKAKTPSCVTDPEIFVPLQIVSSTSASLEIAPTAPTPMPTVNAYPEGWNPNNITTIPIVQASYVGPVSYGGNEVNSAQEFAPYSTTVTPTAPHLSNVEYSFPKLLTELDSCLSVKFKLEELLSDPQWKSIISLLQPTEFMSILQKVMLDFDKVDVTQLLCPHVQLTCSYAVAILRSVSNWLRIQFIQTMLPHIADLKSNQDVLLRELSDWERVATERDLENALMRGNGSRSS